MKNLIPLYAFLEKSCGAYKDYPTVPLLLLRSWEKQKTITQTSHIFNPQNQTVIKVLCAQGILCMHTSFLSELQCYCCVLIDLNSMAACYLFHSLLSTKTS